MTLFRHSVPGLILLACCMMLPCAGCSTPTEQGVAIYLTMGDVAPSAMEMLSHVDLAAEPLISMDDIISYDASTHELTLTAEAFNRIAALEVPVSGKAFVVCVDGNPVYWGAFWTPISSLSFDGVTIWKPLGAEQSSTVQIQLGYPGPPPGESNDPRNSPIILAAFEQAGKLIVRPPNLQTDALPQSMKGYELYSWSEGGEWHFALMTGTNRNKTAQEVLSHESTVSDDGWVHIHAIGVDELEATLNRLPPGQYVSWLPELRDGDQHQDVALPPAATVDVIREYAEEHGLEFSAPTP